MTDQATSPWIELTGPQRGVYFGHRLDPTGRAYSTAEAVQLDGPLDLAALRAAVQGAYDEFDGLRTAFRDDADGPRQTVRPRRVAVPEVDLRHEADPEAAALAWIDRDLLHPLNLAGGEPTRTAVLLLGDERAWWYHCAHHVVMDGFGFLQLARRVGQRYAAAADGAPPPAPNSTGLADVLRGEAELAGDPERAMAAATHWAGVLADMGAPTTLAGRTADPAPRALRSSAALDGAVAQRLAASARALGLHWSDYLLAGLAAYLGRMLGADAAPQLMVPSMNRVLPGAGALPSARAVCTAMTLFPLRATLAPGSTVGELSRQVAASAQASRGQLPLAAEDLGRLLRQHRASTLGPQVNILPFDSRLSFGPLAAAVRNIDPGPAEDMTWTIRGAIGPADAVLRFELDANPQCYDADEVAAHAQRIVQWLGTWAGADPAQPVDRLPLLGAAERERVLVGFNDTDHPVTARTLVQAFREQAARTPDAEALRHGDARWSYRQLDHQARTVAARLHADGVRPGDVVAVAMRRGVGLFAAIYGALACGAAYLPLDPEAPPARLSGMLADAGARVAIVDAPIDGLVADETSSVLVQLPWTECAGPDLREDTGVPHESPVSADGAALDDIAYVLFTSGSTGRPKGVRVSHRAIDNRLQWMAHRFPLAPGERVLHKTPTTFDVSVWELFWPLQVGGTVVIADPGGHRDPRYLAALLAEQDVAVVHFVPSMLAAFLADPKVPELLASSPRGQAAARRAPQVVCSGEALTAELARRAHQVLGSAPVNLYGPTEAAVDVTAWDWSPDDPATDVPIGRPVWNTRCYVLDRYLAPAPIGAPGELYLSGVQIAQGYSGRPDLTAERFLPDPFRDGARMYRTGDRARWRADGALLYLGRADDQVKVHGQRIELGEIDAAIRTSPDVADAAVVARPDPQGDQCLVAYLVPRAGPSRQGAERDPGSLIAPVRAHVAQLLPQAMLPSYWVVLDSLPTNSSGKTDRAFLAAQPLPVLAAATAEPATLLEARLGELLGAQLGAGRALGRDEDFFLAGGHSLLALRLLGGIEATFGRTIALSALFAAGTPARLAELLSEEPASADGSPDVGAASDYAPILPLRAGRPGMTPVFLLPPAGGLGWCYLSMLRHLPSEMPVVALQADGLDGRPAEPPASLEALAARQLELIRSVVGGGAFHLLGWSVGGMAAHAVAASAVADGQSVGAVVLLDAYPADQWSHQADPTEPEALSGVLRMAGIDHQPADGPPLDRAGAVALLAAAGHPLALLPEPVLDASIRNVVRSASLVRRGRHAQLAHDLTMIRATAPRAETWLDAAGWRSHVSGAVEIVDIPVTHPDLVREPAVAEVAGVLLRAIRAASRQPAASAV